jgi:hypothetical protein
VLSAGIVAVASILGDKGRAAMTGRDTNTLIREMPSIPYLFKKGLPSYTNTLALPVLSSDFEYVKKQRKVRTHRPNPILQRSAALRSDGILDLGEYLAAKAKVVGQQLQGSEAQSIMTMTNNEKQTAWNDSGGSKTQFIDRHNVDCLPNAISAFKLERKGQQMRYLYTCAQGLFGPAVGAGTAENEGGGGRMEYLDRHNVECPANMAIAQFKLNSKNDGNTISYSYNCIAPAGENKMTCYDKITSPTSADGFGFKTEYLDRQLVKCDDNRVMQRFHMVSNMAGNSILYEYRCCTVQLAPAAAPSSSSSQPPAKAFAAAAPAGKGSAAQVAGAVAPAGSGITSSAVGLESPTSRLYCGMASDGSDMYADTCEQCASQSPAVCAGECTWDAASSRCMAGGRPGSESGGTSTGSDTAHGVVGSDTASAVRLEHSSSRLYCGVASDGTDMYADTCEQCTAQSPSVCAGECSLDAANSRCMPVTVRASTASSTSTESSAAGSGAENVTASGEIEAPSQESESSSVEESYKSNSYDPFGIENKKKRLEAEKYSQWIAFQKWVKNKKMSNTNGSIKSQKSARPPCAESEIAHVENVRRCRKC